MPTDCYAVLEIAKELSRGESEAHHRSAVSRAYYASLHCVDMTLPPTFAVGEVARRGKGSHDAFIDALTAWGKSTTPGRQSARYAAIKMPRLKSARKKADYYLSDSMSAEEAEQAIKWAEEVFEHLEAASDNQQAAQS